MKVLYFRVMGSNCLLHALEVLPLSWPQHRPQVGERMATTNLGELGEEYPGISLPFWAYSDMVLVDLEEKE